MTNDGLYDPYAEAEEAKPQTKTYFAGVLLEAYPVVFEKGVKGGVRFDPTYHDSKKRRTMVHIALTPLPSSQYTEPFEWWLATFSDDWAIVTLPSIKRVGLTPKSISGKWVRYEIAPVGRTYPAKDVTGNLTGEVKDAMTPKFLEVYDSVEQAEAAASEFYGGNSGQSEPVAVQQAQSTSDARKQTAYNFLGYFITRSRGDLSKVVEAIETNPILKEFYWDEKSNLPNLAHPDVLQLTTELGAEAKSEIPF